MVSVPVVYVAHAEYAASTVTVVRASLVKSREVAAPLSGSSKSTAAVTKLRKIQCTETYQRAQPHVTATLTNGAEYTVTAQSSYASSAPSLVGVLGSGSGTVFAAPDGSPSGAADITATYGDALASANAAAALAFVGARAWAARG